MRHSRYALYYVPPAESGWAGLATRWLGWDMAAGHTVGHPDIAGLPLPVSAITASPRNYGLHATIKPPFRLADGCGLAELDAACAALCAALPPVPLDGLELQRMGRFLALRPRGDITALDDLAAQCVQGLDRFRAPLTDAERDWRRGGGLPAGLERNLTRWGYPYVMEAFRFHITLTGRLPEPAIDTVQKVLDRELGRLLPGRFAIADLALAGADSDGRFHLLRRYPLSG